jgi:Carboxypeptidase regulatory-like domain/TonB dependent receptor
MKARLSKVLRLMMAIIPVVVLLVFPLSLNAQETRGRITGKVTDPNKASIAGAAVKITDIARGTSVSLTTNEEGVFSAPYLLSGTYRVEVEIAGFKKYIQDNVILQISETRDLEIPLEVGAAQETVTVSSEAPTINTSDANLGQTIDQKRMAELPLVHGDPYTLIGLTPGATYTGSARLDRPFEPTHIVGYAIDGTRGNRMDLLIDGAPSTATANANEVIASYVPPSDIVQEFKVQTATFDSQFGNTEGAVTSISIKSGTNQLHGTAYLWTEPGGVAANDFFGNARKQGRPFTFSNRPGFSVSGPVVIPKLYNGKDKTFFLFGYEAIRDARPRFDAGSSVFVPTQALRDGNFAGLGVTIYDPLTSVAGTGANGCAVNTFCRTAFAGNVIPANRINPVSKAILGYLSQPKQPGLLGNIFDSQLTERTKPYDNFTFRVDQSIGANDKLFVRGSWYNRNSIYNEYTASAYSGVNFVFASRQGVIDEVHTFNATTFLNVRYGFNRFIRGQDQLPAARGFDLASLGFPASFANLVPTETRRFPRIDFPANTVLGNGMSNEFRPVSSHSVSAVLNKALNNHSVKFGSELRIYREDDFFQSNDQTGQFTFDNTYTRQSSTSNAGEVSGLQAFASFLLGYPTTANFVRRADYSEYSKTWGFFVQDDWRFSNKLTFNLGLRYEVETPLVERNNKSVSGFDTAYVQPTQSTVQTRYAALNDPALKSRLPQINVTGGLLFAGVDTGKGLYNTPKNTFLPRFGVAYQIDNKTVLRAGFGLFAGFLGERRGDVIQPGYTQTTTAFLAPALSSGQQIPYTLSNVFTGTPILEPVGSSLGRQTALGQAISFFNQNPKVSKQARWQIGLQRELPGGWVAEAVYVENYGYDLEIVRNINALPNRYLNTDNSRTTAMVDNNSFLTGTVINPFANLTEFRSTSLGNATIARSQLLRPFPAFGDILTTNNDGKSTYRSGQFTLQKRFSKGYTVQAGYTWSNWTQATEYLNPADPRPTKMISDQDSPHRFSLSAMYALPFGKSERFFSNPNWITNALFGGWQIGGTFATQSGFPIAFGAYNLTSAATSNDMFYRGGTISGPRTIEKWINTGAFLSVYDVGATAATPVSHLRTLPFRFSDVRRDYIQNVDLSLKKDIMLRESMKIQLKFEALNAFNHPYFVAPVVSPSATNFGAISASNQDNYARRIQLGVKFIF